MDWSGFICRARHCNSFKWRCLCRILIFDIEAYLDYAFGPLASYLFNWTAITALKPGSSAIIASVFATYLNRVILNEEHPPLWLDKIVAILCIISVSALQAMGPHWGTTINNTFTVVKICALIMLTVIGFVWLGMHGAGNFAQPFNGASTNMGNYAMALYSGLWAYDGWYNMIFID